MKRKILAISIAMAVMFSSVLGGSFTIFGSIKGGLAMAETAQNGDFGYSELANSTIQITSYKGTANQVIIPSMIEGKKVSCIGEKAFYKCDLISKVIIPDGVIELGWNCFSGCANLKSVTLPNGLLAIRDGAFRACIKLESIDIPDSVVTLESHAFYACRSLKKLSVPNKITLIPQDLVQYCANLESITLPSSLVSLAPGALCFCFSLKEVIIPEGVTTIGKGAFWRCNKLVSVYIPKSVSQIGTNVFFESNQVIIKCERGSYAQTYAAQQGIPCIADNVVVLEKMTKWSAKSSTKNVVSVKFGTVRLATGYQVKYSKRKNFSKSKIVTTKKQKLSLVKMTSKKKYYIKARAYSTLGGVKVVGKYSSVKKIKVK